MRGWQPPVAESEGRDYSVEGGVLGLVEFVNPINDEIVKGGSMSDRILMGLRSPAVVLLRMTVPVG